MNDRSLALVIAGSENLRESLLVLLRSIPQIDAVRQAEDGPSALALKLESQTELVLLNYRLSGDEPRMTLAQLNGAWPQAHCVVFLDNEQDRQPAQEAGADVVLLKGMRAAAILETIESLLSEYDQGPRALPEERSKNGDL